MENLSKEDREELLEAIRMILDDMENRPDVWLEWLSEETPSSDVPVK